VANCASRWTFSRIADIQPPTGLTSTRMPYGKPGHSLGDGQRFVHRGDVEKEIPRQSPP
jgi:hypothetical protein